MTETYEFDQRTARSGNVRAAEHQQIRPTQEAPVSLDDRLHDDAHAMGRDDGISPLVHALNDGEDFELCVVMAADDAASPEQSGPDPPVDYNTR